MKALFMLVCMLCAALLSLLSYLYAIGRLDPPEEKEEVIAAFPTQELRPTLYPEQTRAVEELMAAIVTRRERLERQEAQLEAREARVRQAEILVERARKEVETARNEIETHFDGWDADIRENSRKLAEFYARMEADNAATLLGRMQPDRAALILTFLSDRQAGQIMDAAVAKGANGIEHAVRWSEIIRTMRKQPPRQDRAQQ